MFDINSLNKLFLSFKAIGQKNIDNLKSEIDNLRNLIQVNELEYAAHTSHSYLKKLEQLYLANNYIIDDELPYTFVSYYRYACSNF